MAQPINYNKYLHQQEQIIMKHFTSPIYVSRNKTTAIPVYKKKLAIKKTLKKQLHNLQEGEINNLDKEKHMDKLTKKQPIYNE